MGPEVMLVNVTSRGRIEPPTQLRTQLGEHGEGFGRQTSLGKEWATLAYRGCLGNDGLAGLFVSPFEAWRVKVQR